MQNKKKQIKELMKLTKNEAIGLYNIIRDIKSGNLSRDAQIKYIPLRVKLKDIVSDFDKLREETSVQMKPEGFEEFEGKEKDAAQKKWNEAVGPILQAFLDKPCDIDTKIFTLEEAIDLLSSNPDLSGSAGDFIVQYFVKKEVS